MTPILFYGVPSGCSFGSIVALEWLGAPYRLCRIRMPEEVSGNDYRRINPIGETPALMTAPGTVVTESMAILNHIGARGIERGLGFAQGTQEFDRLNRMLGYLNTSFFGAFGPLWYLLDHATGQEQKRVLAEYGRADVEKAHAGLEKLIGDGPWLLGEHRTVADAYFVGIARWNEYHGVVDRGDYPSLQRLYDRLQRDPAVLFAHAVEQQKPAASAGGFLGEIELQEALEPLDAAA